MQWFDTLQDHITYSTSKLALLVGGVIVYMGTEIEPRAGVWVVAFGGSFMAIAMGKDRAFFSALTRLGLGVGVGISTAGLMDWWIHMPKIPTAFFFALMGVELYYATKSSIRDGSLLERITGLFKRSST